MSGVLQLVARIAAGTGVPADAAENVVHLDVAGSDPSGQDLTDAMNSFRDFYTVATGAQTLAIGKWLSEAMSRGANACSILAYFTNDYSGATPFGSPIGQINFTLPAAEGVNQFPEEVAVCLSFNGDLTDVPQTAPNPLPPPAPAINGLTPLRFAPGCPQRL